MEKEENTSQWLKHGRGEEVKRENREREWVAKYGRGELERKGVGRKSGREPSR